MKILTRAPPAIPRARLIRGHRYRTPAGKIYPSVTTVLGATKPADAVDGLEAWRASVGAAVADYIMREAATIGTQAHRLNEDYLNRTKSGEARLLARAHHGNFRPYLDRIGTIYGTEVPLYSDMMEVAGTADCIGEYMGVPSVVDYKTKRVPQQPDWIADYWLQTAAYCMMFRELSGIEIRQCVVLVSSERDTVQEFTADPRDHAAAFLLRLAKYDGMMRQHAGNA